MIQEDKIIIEGIVDEILFTNSSNGYIVLELDKGDGFVTVVGELGNIEVGEELSLTGKFVQHPRFGSQFNAEICTRKLPETSVAILKYLSSGVIKGIGSTLAKRIVQEFGDKSLEIIENEPEQLLKIKGFTHKKIEEVSIEFKRIYGIRTLMIFLSQYGIQPSIALKAWKKWGQYAVDVIKENPYVLCEYGIELEFEKAEQVAETMEHPKDSESRVRAGVFHILLQNTFSGHTCLPYDRLMSTAVKLLEVSEEKFDECIKNECTENNLVIYEKENRRFVFLYDYYNAEQYIAGRLNVLNSFMKDSEYDYSRMIDIEESSKTITYAEQQRKAISLALSKGFIVLTGGPGTGKTTTLKAIISLYEQRGLKVQIAAPTGKAAKRISDLTGYDAKTIHRLLEVMFDNSGKPKFKHNETEPLSCDVMIVDEMSMVDTLLFEALLRAMKLSCRLIMVGDSDQLPSVGAGNILKDMIDSGKLSVIQLTEIFRQAQQSCIVTNAHKIVNGDNPDLTRTDNDFFFMQRLDVQIASETVVDLCVQRLPNAYGYSSTDDIQVLCPSRKGPLGVVEINKALQFAINPPEKKKNEIKGIYYTFRDNDKVMQIKNNYDIVWKKDGESGTGIFNGDIGNIVKISKNEGRIVIDFEGRIAEYTSEMLEQLELAYAITVHKSQGSEFNVVILPLLGGFEKLYYRNLLYTAVTRAKKMLIIVGSKNVVERMVANNRRTLRYSCLKDMIDKELG
ncbi:MAG: ATP-dependent RecD-like DNA helicase [Ruminococcus sp.]|nr:ATP-dependent RecD-like DNA helicase [Ruminococcus sp.]